MRRTRDSLAQQVEALFGLETPKGIELVRAVIGALGYRTFTMEALRVLADAHRDEDKRLDRERDRRS